MTSPSWEQRALAAEAEAKRVTNRVRYARATILLTKNRMLRAKNERLREALGRVEWSFRQTALRNGGTIYTATLCPACMGEKDPPDDKGSPRRRGDPLPPAGHKSGCWLRAALKETR